MPFVFLTNSDGTYSFYLKGVVYGLLICVGVGLIVLAYRETMDADQQVTASIALLGGYILISSDFDSPVVARGKFWLAYLHLSEPFASYLNEPTVVVGVLTVLGSIVSALAIRNKATGLLKILLLCEAIVRWIFVGLVKARSDLHLQQSRQDLEKANKTILELRGENEELAGKHRRLKQRYAEKSVEIKSLREQLAAATAAHRASVASGE